MSIAKNFTMRRREFLMAASVSAVLPVQSGVCQSGSARIQEAAQRIAREGFSGATLVVKDRRVLLDQSFGVVRGERMRRTSRFWIASMGKQFTSAAIMRCVDLGHVRVESTLSELWPEAPAEKSSITIRQILSHSSGLPQSDSAELAATGEQACKNIFALDLAAAPGAQFIYSNANNELAAAIVERASGSTYSHFIRNEIIMRAGLRNTGQYPDVREPHVVPIIGERPARLDLLRWGGQGYFSTTHDLFNWHRSLLDGRVLSALSVNALFAPVIPIQEGFSALGWFLGRTDHGALRIFTRGNEDSGPNGLFYYYPSTKTSIVVLTHAGYKDDDMSWSRAMHGALEAALEL